MSDEDNLEFQDFSHSSAPRSSLGDLSAPIGSESFVEDARPTGNVGSEYSCWNIRYYAQWFNVDTSDVISRVGFSTVPISNRFFDKVNGNPDLYGPVWISSTVVFMLAATGNFASWLNYAREMGMNHPGWESDFTKMTFGATIIYCYAFLVPLVVSATRPPGSRAHQQVFFVLKYAGSRLTLTDVICLYGYSLFIYIPASILCIPPSAGLQWAVVAVAGAASTASVVRTLQFEAQRDSLNARVTTPLLMGVGLLSVAMAVVLKLFLFENAEFVALIEGTTAGGAIEAMSTTMVKEVAPSMSATLAAGTTALVESPVQAILANEAENLTVPPDEIPQLAADVEMTTMNTE